MSFLHPCPFPLLCLSLPGKFLTTLHGPTPAPPVTSSTFPCHGTAPPQQQASSHCLGTNLSPWSDSSTGLSGGRDPVAIASVSPRPSRKPDLDNVEFSKCLLNVWKEIRAKILQKCKNLYHSLFRRLPNKGVKDFRTEQASICIHVSQVS